MSHVRDGSLPGVWDARQAPGGSAGSRLGQDAGRGEGDAAHDGDHEFIHHSRRVLRYSATTRQT